MNDLALGVLRNAPRLLAVAAVVALTGCATTANVDQHAADPRRDPLEPFNRKMFAFNDQLDKYVLKPTATAYNNVLPSPVRKGVHNVFGNFADAWSAVNQVLQGKVGDGAEMTLRFVTNTVIGIAGIFDVASDIGLDRRSEDLGQTFGVWGVQPGPYLVLPLFGSSDFRDAIALPADDYVTPALLVKTTWQGVAVDAVGVVDARAGLLGASQMLDELAFDRYTFMRDAYVTRRRSLVYDGNPPPLPGDDDDSGVNSAPVPAGSASGTQGGVAPALPATPASGAKSSMAEPESNVVRLAYATPVPSPTPTPAPSPVPSGGVTPAPMPASAPVLPVPMSGPAPVPPPPASAPRA